ncbi:hypothetical protein [Campylobacter sp. LR264d]|uniref:hypothetical protein n=1 Tax=Campylobacter sp. LR264d TaxID=2593544 RepID=UPI001CC1E2E5|nr:hypothetical protein [Campylobacter sp. LR264d]
MPFLKGLTHFVPGDLVVKYADEIFNDLKENRLFCGLESDEFLDKITDFFANLNALHPFRERAMAEHNALLLIN